MFSELSFSFVFAIILKAWGNDVSITTNQYGINSVKLSDYGAFPTSEQLIFQAKGCRDAYVNLLSQNEIVNPMFVMVIGGWGNGRSLIEKRHNVTSVVFRVDQYGEMDCNSYKTFWVSWENGNIRIGRGNVVGSGVSMFYYEVCPFRIQDIIIGTGQGSTVHWKIPTVDCWSFLHSTMSSLYEFVDKTIHQFRDMSINQTRPSELYTRVEQCPTFEILKTVTIAAYSGTNNCGRFCIAEQDCKGFRYVKEKDQCELTSDKAINTMLVTYYKLQKIKK